MDEKPWIAADNERRRGRRKQDLKRAAVNGGSFMPNKTTSRACRGAWCASVSVFDVQSSISAGLFFSRRFLITIVQKRKDQLFLIAADGNGLLQFFALLSDGMLTLMFRTYSLGLSAQIFPLWEVTILRAMASPNP